MKTRGEISTPSQPRRRKRRLLKPSRADSETPGAENDRSTHTYSRLPHQATAASFQGLTNNTRSPLVVGYKNFIAASICVVRGRRMRPRAWSVLLAFSLLARASNWAQLGGTNLQNSAWARRPPQNLTRRYNFAFTVMQQHVVEQIATSAGAVSQRFPRIAVSHAQVYNVCDPHSPPPFSSHAGRHWSLAVAVAHPHLFGAL